MSAESFTQRLIRETRALQGLSDRIEDDPVSVELAARFLALAPTPASHGSAAVVEAGASGAAGASSGKSGLPAASTTRRKATARTVAFHDNAG